MAADDSMRRDWDERARRDAFRYIASWRDDWDADSFLQSGEEDYQKLVEPVLSRWKWSTEAKVMLELGCGAGRMTDSFARRFQRVHAFDVSGEMLQRGKSLLRDRHNIIWAQGGGKDLTGVGDNSVDFVFSYLVLQHLPTQALVHHYVQEILRVLKEEGAFLFQFNGSRRPTMNWKGRAAWGIVDGLWTLRLNRLSQAIASVMGLDPRMGGKTWHGASVDAAAVVRTAKAAGGGIWGVMGENTPMTWCCGLKKGPGCR